MLETEFSDMFWCPLVASLFHCWAVMWKISTALFYGKFVIGGLQILPVMLTEAKLCDLGIALGLVF